MNTVDFSENDIRRMSRSDTVEKDKPVRKILIGTPYIETKGGQAIQWCNISLDGVQKKVYFSVDEKYADYLCAERGDAYVIGLLSLAMRERCDIHSEVSLTGDLIHQIETELIPPVTKFSNHLYAPKITGKLDNEPLPSANKIATGCSCGIDSLHAIKFLTEERGGMYKPDYLVINNVGAYTSDGKTSSTRYEDNSTNARQFAEDFGTPLIVTDSNFANAFPQEHLLTHLYSSCFAIYMLRKLWSRYYYASSGVDSQERFSLIDNEKHDPCKYDVIALPALSISQLRICNESPHASRFEKTQYLANDKLVHKYLNVCLRQGKGHCGLCPKCTRTLWTLDAIGKLDNFSEVFPVNQYRAIRKYYLRELYRSHRRGVQMISEAYAVLSKDMSPLLKLHALAEEKFQYSGWWHTLKRIIKSILKE